ncbi:uncharacterized protein LOC132277450 [Cornus florida]|uniref:uncharacterized protein LOC132277450 n=1 Tax=Cornus florida TaxID=4283 RepID=UPI0028A0FDF8|nr:uncharacterized protein LOC132277450 [Cornus florida]
MEFSDIDNVKVEKEKAMMRYRRRRKIAKVLRLLEVCVALAVLSWWSARLPTAVLLSGEYLLQQLPVSLSSTHIAFLIGNAIAVAIYLLSRQNDPGDNGGFATDFYDEYIQSSGNRQRTTTVPDGKMTPETAEETTNHDRQMVVSENAVTKLETAMKQATKEIRRFQRTQSEKLKREIRAKPRRELRRSETDNDRSTVLSGGRRSMSSFDTVDTLSNEEFQQTIDAVIAEHRRSLWTQKVVDENH